MKGELTTRVGVGRSSGFGSIARSLVLRTKIAIRDRIELRAQNASKTAGPSVQVRQSELIEFYNLYEEFVELLCDAAQYGPNPRLECNYGRLQTAISPRYTELRPFVGAFLEPDNRDAFRFETGRPQDAFEKLFEAPTLGDFLQYDDGEMIFRIMKTREALNLYGEHLRQLSSRVA